MQVKIIVFCCILVLFQMINAQQSLKLTIPQGWKKPQNKLFFMDWRKEDSSMFLTASADYNGDGVLDSILILEPQKKIGVGLFLFLFKKNGTVESIKLYDTQNDTSLKKTEDIEIFVRYYGVRNVKPGMYQTACGKGYFECLRDEPQEILLKNTSIDFFHFDAGGTRYFYWENLLSKILFQWMDD